MEQLPLDAPQPQDAPSTIPAADPPPPPTAHTPVPPSNASAPPTIANDRPLNVNDALGYLDEVKNRFHDRPNVYNQFLDIMKDFKSQVLTTPGVIERVSVLFSGHAELVSGFNTFLPPGYKIECSSGDNQLITVTTPSGTLTQNSSGSLTAQGGHNAPSEPARQDVDGTSHKAEPEHTVEAPHPPHTPLPPISHVSTPQPHSQPPAPPTAPAHVAPPPPNPSVAVVAMSSYSPSLVLSPSQALNSSSTTASAASVLGGMHRVSSNPEPVHPHPAHPPAAFHPSLPQAQIPPAASPTPLVTPGFPPQPTEFNHAIQYINRIKTRFADEPETYKQFLEILQTYQKEQRLLHDVYAQVTQLFRSAPDLIDEFKMFLPDANATTNGIMTSMGIPPPPPTGFGNSTGGTVGVMGVLGQTGAPPVTHDTEWTMEVQSVKGDKGAGYRRKVGGSDQNREGPPVKKRRKATEKDVRDRDRDRERESIPAKGISRSKHPHQRVPDPASPPFPPYGYPPSPHVSSQHQQMAMSHLSTSHPPLSQVPALSAPPEVFFERVKRVLDDRDAWDEFLKLLNLYNSDILDEAVLLRAAAPFLGGFGSELEMQFRAMLGAELPGRRDEFGALPAAAGHAHGYGHPTGMGSTYLSGQKYRYGPSYRRLPDSETTLACSGRDELCRAVLNDDWVSHPTWASEESGFIAHKKNAFEEALHKSEEERHEYHVHLEAMAHTISLLEPIAYKINDMVAEERATFRLRPDLGGRTASVYQKIIKKVYGRENAQEVLLALQENPAAAVPVVVDRLKLVDAEWRKNKREWEKVWRDVDARNFYKSLDHQGVGFKANDKKAITGKALVAEIERMKEMQDSRRAAEEEDSAPQADNPRVRAKRTRVLPRHQLEYDMHDEGVLQDALKLTVSFLERNDQRQSGSSVPQYNAVERRRIEAFLRHYVMHQFGLGPEFDAVFGPPVDQAEWEDLGLYVADGDPESAEDDDVGTARKNRKSGKRSGGSGSGAAVSAGDLNKKLHKTKRAMEKAHRRKTHDTSKAQSSSNSSRPSPESSRPGSPAPAGSQPLSPLRTQQSLPAQSRRKGLAISLEDDVWLRHVEVVIHTQEAPITVNGVDHPPSDTAENHHDTKHRHFGSFFCNNTFYTLVRLLQLLYSRLMACKNLAAKLAADPSASFLPNPVAMDLGLVDTAGPAGYFAKLAAGMFPPETRPRPRRFGAKLTFHPADHEKSSSSNPAEYFYVHLLDLVEKVFDGDLDQTTFEENTRFMFGTRAFVVYTLDRLCGAICKQVQAVVQDSRCHELMNMLEQQRARDLNVDTYGEEVDIQSVIRYRRQAEELVGVDENLYRVDWFGENKSLRIQLLDKDDLSIDPPCAPRRVSSMAQQGTTPETVTSRMSARWKQYVQSYVLRYPTEGRRVGVGRKVFLQKSLLEEDADELADTRWINDSRPDHGLEVMIGLGTCKLYYVTGCEEAMWRVRLAPASLPSENGRAATVESRKRKGRKKRRVSEEEEDVEDEEEQLSAREKLKERVEARAKERKRWIVSFDQGHLF